MMHEAMPEKNPRRRFELTDSEEFSEGVDKIARDLKMNEDQKAYLVEAVEKNREGERKSFTDANDLAIEIFKLTNDPLRDYQAILSKLGSKKVGDKFPLVRMPYTGLEIWVAVEPGEGEGVTFVIEDIIINRRMQKIEGPLEKVKRLWGKL